MPDERYLRLDECRTRDDLERIDPREYARLVATPATMLDLFREKLDLAEAVRTLAERDVDVARAASRAAVSPLDLDSE